MKTKTLVNNEMDLTLTKLPQTIKKTYEDQGPNVLPGREPAMSLNTLKYQLSD